MSDIMLIVGGHPSDYFPMEHDGHEVAPWMESTLMHSDNLPQLREGVTKRQMQVGDRVTLATLQNGPQGERPVAVPFASTTIAEVAEYDEHHHLIRFTDTSEAV